MRTGLLVVGTLVAIVGAGLLVSLFYLPSDSPATRVYVETITALGPNQTQTEPLSEVSAASGSLALSWTSSGLANVSVWGLGPCPGGQGLCAVGPPLVVWTSNLTGHWTLPGPISAAYLVSVTNIGDLPITFSGTVTENYNVAPTGQSIPVLAFVTIGGVALLVIGGVAVFLGLFLAGGVYRTPRSGIEQRDASDDESDDEGESDPLDSDEL